jgi:hypothetical protein
MRFGTVGRIVVAAVVAAGVVVEPAAAWAGAAGRDTTFTLVVLPDTQLAVQNKPELFEAQTQWILDNRQASDIRFVVHVGDVVEWPSRTTDWERATAAMYPLNGQVPYGIAVGNHDLDAWACTPPGACDPRAAIAVDRSTTMFNTYFPWQMFHRWPSFGGAFPRYSSDNTFFEFSGGGVRWLVVNLKYDPTEDELAWADQVVRRHRRHQVIINTHEYQRATVRTAVGDRVWNAVARRHPNVQFVLSGHFSTAGARVDAGDHGNPVYQIEADYQTYSLPDVNENSYLRLMAFDTRAGTVDVKTFSPYCESTAECPAYKTDANNQFTLTGVQFPTDSDA